MGFDDDAPRVDDTTARGKPIPKHPLADLLAEGAFREAGRSLAVGVFGGLVVAGQGGLTWLVAHVSAWIDRISGGPNGP